MIFNHIAFGDLAALIGFAAVPVLPEMGVDFRWMKGPPLPRSQARIMASVVGVIGVAGTAFHIWLGTGKTTNGTPYVEIVPPALIYAVGFALLCVLLGSNGLYRVMKDLGPGHRKRGVVGACSGISLGLYVLTFAILYTMVGLHWHRETWGWIAVVGIGFFLAMFAFIGLQWDVPRDRE